MDVVRTCKFDSAFTFIFSPREGTPALKLKDDTSLTVKEERLQKLNKLVNELSLEANELYVGKKVKVLINGESEKGTDKISGYTETMKLVNVLGSKDKIGQIVEVEITEAKSFSLNGVCL